MAPANFCSRDRLEISDSVSSSNNNEPYATTTLSRIVIERCIEGVCTNCKRAHDPPRCRLSLLRRTIERRWAMGYLTSIRTTVRSLEIRLFPCSPRSLSAVQLVTSKIISPWIIFSLRFSPFFSLFFSSKIERVKYLLS